MRHCWKDAGDGDFILIKINIFLILALYDMNIKRIELWFREYPELNSAHCQNSLTPGGRYALQWGTIIALAVRAVNSHSVVLRIIPTHSLYPRHLVLYVPRRHAALLEGRG